MENTIYDDKLIKDGQKLKRLYLLYIDGDEKECDCCDETKVCASIEMMWGDIAIVCKDCLQLIINEFGENNE